ncbi:uncharacterized protein BDR25DRAFT_107125 [Lindgomyces ingoldianus]|uniref:Uncharacterized protein n=1 Tax=Lindgomyces ingoldianus TaxID=673940 RepID=A0ACB6QAS7_9PLEO|nr:uncharacterized protein BDR25DRAFT_107125 [Lindgomyces ingoldianus]KAF2463600.1 hypothetical protein BDR25DRAFT_107125 [Lindgomyces ingoldianus]
MSSDTSERATTEAKYAPMPSTWRRNISEDSSTKVYLEGGYTPLGKSIHKRSLVHFAPALENYLEDPFGDKIVLPAGSVDENAADTVVSGIAHAATHGGNISVWYAYNPIACIEMHRVFTLFGMKSEGDEALEKLWSSLKQVALSEENVGWIWYTFEEDIFNKEKINSPPWPVGPYRCPHAGEYIHAMLYQLLNLAHENKLSKELTEFMDSHPRLKALGEERKKDCGLQEGFNSSKSARMVRRARKAAEVQEAALVVFKGMSYGQDRKANHFASLQWSERKGTPPPATESSSSGETEDEEGEIQNRNEANDVQSLSTPEDKKTIVHEDRGTRSLTPAMEDALNRQRPSLNLSRAGAGISTINAQGNGMRSYGRHGQTSFPNNPSRSSGKMSVHDRVADLSDGEVDEELEDLEKDEESDIDKTAGVFKHILTPKQNHPALTNNSLASASHTSTPKPIPGSSMVPSITTQNVGNASTPRPPFLAPDFVPGGTLTVAENESSINGRPFSAPTPPFLGFQTCPFTNDNPNQSPTFSTPPQNAPEGPNAFANSRNIFERPGTALGVSGHVTGGPTNPFGGTEQGSSHSGNAFSGSGNLLGGPSTLNAPNGPTTPFGFSGFSTSNAPATSSNFSGFNTQNGQVNLANFGSSGTPGTASAGVNPPNAPANIFAFQSNGGPPGAASGTRRFAQAKGVRRGRIGR